MPKEPIDPGAGWRPYTPGTRRYPDLSEVLGRELALVVPSRGHDLIYKPCCVELASGDILDATYVQDAHSYIRTWGVWPEDDPGKYPVDVARVTRIMDSSTRLPSRFAEELYRAGESRMGGCLFTVLFTDGSRQVYETGGAVDFIDYPAGKGPQDVEAVFPHEGHEIRPRLGAVKYHWCLYGTGTSNSSGWCRDA